MTENLNCKSTQKRLATLWGFVPGTPETISAARSAQAEELREVAQQVANIGEYREIVDAMALCLRPHERPAFIQLYREKAKAALAVATRPELALAPGIFQCDISPRPLNYPLSDYHQAPGGGPLHATWQDKPHRIVYDLIAAVRYYAASAMGETAPAKENALQALAADLRARADRTAAPGNELYVLGLREAADAASSAQGRADEHRLTEATDTPDPGRTAVDADGACTEQTGQLWGGEQSADVLHCYWIMMRECESQADSKKDHVLRVQVEGFYRQWNKLNGTDLEPIWVTRSKPAKAS